MTSVVYNLMILEYPTLDEYITSCVNKMGVEAEGLAI